MNDAEKLILISYEGVEQVSLSWSIVKGINHHQPSRPSNWHSLSLVHFSDRLVIYYHMESQLPQRYIPIISISSKTYWLPASITKTILFLSCVTARMHKCIFSWTCRDINAQLQMNANKLEYCLYQISLMNLGFGPSLWF